MLDWRRELVCAVVVASVVRIAERAWPNPAVQLLRRILLARVDGMMLLLTMAGLLKRVLPGRGNGLAKRVETTGIGKCTFFFGLLGGFTL